MLSVKINQDIEQYQEPVAFGLNAKQSIAALLAIFTCGGIACLLYFVAGLSREISIYVALPFCVPIMLPVLNKNHGLTVTQQLRGSNRKKRVLAYGAVIPEKEIRKESRTDGKSEREQKRGKERGKKPGKAAEKENSKKRPLFARQK